MEENNSVRLFPVAFFPSLFRRMRSLSARPVQSGGTKLEKDSIGQRLPLDVR